MALLDNFRQNLQEACEKANVSQAELARRTGLHVITVNRIWNGKLMPTLATCESLAKAAGMRPDAAFLEPVKNSA